MKSIAHLLIAFAAVLGTFGYWGVFTRSGRKEYDEMAGMIPGFALLIATIFIFVALVIYCFLFFNERKRRKKTKPRI
jgi:uncharacterized membrane protein